MNELQRRKKKMKNEAKRERVDDINKCGTLASIGEYLEDNAFNSYPIQKILDMATNKVLKHNFTQYQLQLQALKAVPRAYAVLLRIMEVRFKLERLEL